MLKRFCYRYKIKHDHYFNCGNQVTKQRVQQLKH